MFQIQFSKCNWILLVLVLGFYGESLSAAVLKIATVSPEGTTWMVKMREAAKKIRSKTHERVKIKFYSGGVMGSDESVLRKIRIGQLHGGAVTGGSLIEIYPDIVLYSLPFMFRSLDEVDAVRDKMDNLMVNGLEDKGFVTFGLAEGGFAYLMSNKAVRTAGDLKSQKVWIVSGDKLSQDVFESAQISPIPLPLSDVMTGLQTGLIDTIATSPIAAIALQWHTRIKFVTDTPLSYFFGLLTVSKKAFNKLSASDQVIVKNVMSKTFNEINRQNRIDNRKAREALKNQGIEFVKMPANILKEWKNIARAVRHQMEKDRVYDVELLDQMQKILVTFRQSTAPLASN